MQKGNGILKTDLRDRTLWFDGTIETSPEKVVNFLLDGISIDSLSVTEVTNEISQFNQLSGKRLGVKTECGSLDTTFLIPKEYFEIDLRSYFVNKQLARNEGDFENERRLARIDNELSGFEEMKYTEVLRTIIYLIDVFKEKKVVWGVGRGSSCASYLLFLIGVHLVDPVKYQIPSSEFLHE